MTCTDVRRRWMLYLDSEGDPELHFRISDHLAMCPACAEWLRRRRRFEQALRERLAGGEATPELWSRVLASAGDAGPTASSPLWRGLRTAPQRGRRTWLMRGSLLAAAASVLLAVAAGLWFAGRASSSDLPAVAVRWHERLLPGGARPDLESTSDQEVDRYLKATVPFSVHCPPEKDVNFAVRGAGVCKLKGDRVAAYIVGRVGEASVSILVLDHSDMDAFPAEMACLQGGNRHRCSEGPFHMISGVVAGNVVVVVSSAPTEDLERLLNAYGTYPEG